MNKESEKNENILRISLDTKNSVKVGNFSRRGKNRVETKAYDHDFGNESIVPFGILLPLKDEIYMYMSETKVTADFIVDSLDEFWTEHSNRFPHVNQLLINQDNGPENSSRRTQFIKRIVEFSAKHNKEVILAYYPPYHSKYNPIERAWGVLEAHWNGELLDSKETVVNFASTMTYKGKNPVVKLVDKVYETGKTLIKSIMEIYESALERMQGLEKWFVVIKPETAKNVIQAFANI